MMFEHILWLGLYCDFYLTTFVLLKSKSYPSLLIALFNFVKSLYSIFDFMILAGILCSL